MFRLKLVEAELAELREQVESDRLGKAKLLDVILEIKAWKLQSGSTNDNMSKLLTALEDYLDR